MQFALPFIWAACDWQLRGPSARFASLRIHAKKKAAYELMRIGIST